MGIYDPFFSEFPDSIQNYGDAGWAELAVIMDGIDEDLRNAVLGMKDFWDEDKCPDEYLPFVSFAIHGRAEYGEESIIKRKKIWTATSRHKVKGQEGSILDLIEEVTGVRPQIIPPFEAYDIWESKNNLIPPPYDFMKWGSKELLEGGGMTWRSKNSPDRNLQQRGEIYINLKLAGLSPMVIRKITRIIEYAGAAFFRYFIGDLSGAGWYEYRQIY